MFYSYTPKASVPSTVVGHCLSSVLCLSWGSVMGDFSFPADRKMTHDHVAIKYVRPPIPLLGLGGVNSSHARLE